MCSYSVRLFSYFEASGQVALCDTILPQPQKFSKAALLMSIWRSYRLPKLRSSFIPEGGTQIKLFSAGRKWVNFGQHIYKADRSTFKFQHAGTWSAAGWQPCCLCYRPAVFFCHLRLIALSIPQSNIGAPFKFVLFQCLTFLKNS